MIIASATPDVRPTGIAMMKILVVEDDSDIRELVSRVLREAGYEVISADDGTRALEIVLATRFDLAIFDVHLPGIDGLALFREISKQAPETKVVIMTANATILSAVNVVKDGARDYLVKPFGINELLDLVDKIQREHEVKVQLREARAELAGMGLLPVIVARSPEMLAALRRMETIAKSHAPVLITGESGTGKELVARAIHDKSPRSDGPFVVVNCAALPEGLIEAELFGHERGAFTGALQRRDGRFKAAHGGTIFFDEVAEMPLSTQAKLLRVLQDGTFEPLGSDTSVAVNVRVVSATHRNLSERIAQELFREDLYFRLNVLDIRLPALRDRRSELPFLLEYFMQKFGRSGATPSISERAMFALSLYPFPGNVRELSHAVEHAVVLAQGEEIDLQHLPPAISGRNAQGSERLPQGTLSEAMKEYDKECVDRALRHTGGNKLITAKLLGISRKTLWEKIRKYGL